MNETKPMNKINREKITDKPNDSLSWEAESIPTPIFSANSKRNNTEDMQKATVMIAKAV